MAIRRAPVGRSVDDAADDDDAAERWYSGTGRKIPVTCGALDGSQSHSHITRRRPDCDMCEKT